MVTRKKPGVIGILTGGGDVPGLNPAIRAVTIRALREGYKVIGLRRGWAGIMDVIRDEKVDNSNNSRSSPKKWSTGPGVQAALSCTPRAPTRAK